MSKLKLFFNKPRNLYYRSIALLTIITALTSISFSYYIGETGNSEYVSLRAVDNQIQSDYLTDNTLTIKGNESITFNLYVMSNNSFESLYKLYYKASDDTLKVTVDKVYPTIDAHSVHLLSITVDNYSSVEQKVELGIVSGYKGTNLQVEGNEITEK